MLWKNYLCINTRVIELAARTGALFEGIVKLPSIGMLSPSKWHQIENFPQMWSKLSTFKKRKISQDYACYLIIDPTFASEWADQGSRLFLWIICVLLDLFEELVHIKRRLKCALGRFQVKEKDLYLVAIDSVVYSMDVEAFFWQTKFALEVQNPRWRDVICYVDYRSLDTVAAHVSSVTKRRFFILLIVFHCQSASKIFYKRFKSTRSTLRLWAWADVGLCRHLQWLPGIGRCSWSS